MFKEFNKKEFEELIFNHTAIYVTKSYKVFKGTAIVVIHFRKTSKKGGKYKICMSIPV
jgi:hypothetical protein